MKQGHKNAIAWVIASAGAILTTPLFAAGEHYLSAQLAYTDVTDTHTSLSNGTAIAATYGLPLPRLHRLHEHLGEELEYTRSVSNPKYEEPPRRTEFDYYTVALYTLMTFAIRERISLRGRAGVLYEKWVHHDNVLGDKTDSGFDLSIGGGAIYISSPSSPS